MGLFDANAPFDRNRVLRDASSLQAKGKLKKAIAQYRRLLVAEPDNPELHAKLAPLLARTRQYFDAWRSFRVAGGELVRINRLDHALGTYKEALRYLPHEIDAWRAVAEIEVKLDRKRDAVQTLLKGRHVFRARHLRPQAISLLRRARNIDPWHEQVVLDLAKLLSKTDQRDEARMLLDDLAARSKGKKLRRVRAAQWRLSRSLQNTWLWLRAVAVR